MLGLLSFALLAIVPLPAAAVADPGSFRVGAGVVCALTSPATVVCSGTRSGSMMIRSNGTPASTRTRVGARAGTPQLRPGRTWRRDGIACVARAAEVSCTNRSGAVLVLGATRVAVLPGGGGATSP